MPDALAAAALKGAWRGYRWSYRPDYERAHTCRTRKMNDRSLCDQDVSSRRPAAKVFAVAFGVIAIIVGSMVVALLVRKGFDIAMARWIASGILWILF